MIRTTIRMSASEYSLTTEVNNRVSRTDLSKIPSAKRDEQLTQYARQICQLHGITNR